jgi:methylphosphotriester-DNA--protein-cysteine methyltransferase
MFGGMQIPFSVRDLARAVDVDESSIRNWMKDAELCTPGTLLNGARAAQAIAHLDGGRRALEVVAREVGWPARTMRSAFVRLIGASVHRTARSMSADDIANRLADKMCSSH